MSDDEILEVLRNAASHVRHALDGVDDWRAGGKRSDQYALDISADDACTAVLDDAGFGWLSEESGRQHDDRAIWVIVDPVDGSTNASLGLPWFATSLCAVNESGPRCSLVVNQALGTEYSAIRGKGSLRDGVVIEPRVIDELGDAILSVSGWPAAPIACRQARMFGAAALDLCAVADGTFDGYIDLSPPAHGIWDYAGALLICEEVGVGVVDAFGQSLWDATFTDRRTPVACASPALLSALVDVRRSQAWPNDPPPVDHD